VPGDPSKRPRGRPKIIDEPAGTSLTAWVSADQYNRLYRLAKRTDQSLSGLVRHLLSKQQLPHDPDQ
jgi:hypothetical protein